MDIANLIQRLTESGLTQAEIGKEIGCGQSTVSDMANGKIGTVRPSYRIVSGLMELADKRGLRSAQRPGSPRRRSTDKKRS